MKTISLRQPWAYLLCAGIKDIENRTWKLPEKYKGERVLIHASGTTAKDPHMIFNNNQTGCIGDRIMDVITSYHTRSAIIGSVRFVDCVINHESIWAEKMDRHQYANQSLWVYNWVVADPILFDNPIQNVKGKLSFWEYDMRNVLCPECGNPTHCQFLGDVLTDAFCMKCEKGVKQNN